MRMRRDVRVPAVRSMGMNTCVCVYYRNSDGERERWSERGNFMYYGLRTCSAHDLQRWQLLF